MSEHTTEKHPTEAAYDAGIAFAKRHPRADMRDARRASRDWEDSEAFLDGFVECWASSVRRDDHDDLRD